MSGRPRAPSAVAAERPGAGRVRRHGSRREGEERGRTRPRRWARREEPGDGGAARSAGSSGSRTADGGPAGRSVAGSAWTPAHSEAAVFLGECVAVGAVLGFLAELARLLGEEAPWRGPGALRILTRSG